MLPALLKIQLVELSCQSANGALCVLLRLAVG